MTFNIHSLYSVFSRYFRTKRMRDVVDQFQLSPETTVLDVGGSIFNWDLIDVRPRLTLLNVQYPPAQLPDGVNYVTADGTNLPFADNCFDLVFSNSVIEHVGAKENQEKFAGEIRRVGRRYYVQTPNYYFPIEPHLIAPFIHWFPMPAQIRLVRWFSIWGLLSRPDVDARRAFLCAIRLLTFREMQRLFPDGKIVTENFLALPKSIIALKV